MQRNGPRPPFDWRLESCHPICQWRQGRALARQWLIPFRSQRLGRASQLEREWFGLVEENDIFLSRVGKAVAFAGESPRWLQKPVAGSLKEGTQLLEVS